MTATFELTTADLEESLRPPAPAKPNQSARTQGRQLIITGLLVAVSVILYLTLSSTRPPNPAAAALNSSPNWIVVDELDGTVWIERLNILDVQTQLTPVIIASLPGIAFVLAITIFDFQQRRRSEDIKAPKSSNLLGYLLFGVIITGVVAALWAANSTPMRFEVDRKTSIYILLGVGIGVLLLTLLGLRVSVRGVAGRIATSPLVMGTTTMDIEADRIHTMHRLYENTQSWECISHAFETPNLFVLHVVKGGGTHIVPKRGFADPIDVHRVRALLMTKLPEGNYMTPPAAFPVIAPSPVIPIQIDPASTDERRAE